MPAVSSENSLTSLHQSFSSFSTFDEYLHVHINHGLADDDGRESDTP
jgi:hypothetical protein